MLNDRGKEKRCLISRANFLEINSHETSKVQHVTHYGGFLEWNADEDLGVIPSGKCTQIPWTH